MALATGPTEWTLPRKYRRLAPCRSRIPLLTCGEKRHVLFAFDQPRQASNLGANAFEAGVQSQRPA